MNRHSAFAILLAAVVLAGCGTTKEDRAITGAGIGAAAGAVGGAILGVPLEGAALGGAMGAAAGALLDPAQVDLGKPVYK